MTLKEKQQEIVAEFEFLEDWEQKYEYIIDLGKELKGIPEERKKEANLIKGCQSKVWIEAEFKDDKLELNIKDNGVGFDEYNNKAGNGLKNIQSRVQELKGTIKIDSAKDEGTTIEILIPKSSFK